MRKHIVRAGVAVAVASLVGVGAASSASAQHREEVIEGPGGPSGTVWCDFTPAQAPTQGGTYSNCR